MAILASEAYEAGYTAGAANPRITFDAAWATFNAGNRAANPITLYDEFKRGYSSAMSFRMQAY